MTVEGNAFELRPRMSEVSILSGAAAPNHRSIELFSRNSIHSLRSPSVASLITRQTSSVAFNVTNQDNLWRLQDLRRLFRNTELESLYKKYHQRLLHANLKAYLLMQMFISLCYVVVILALNGVYSSSVIPEVLANVVLFVMSLLFYVIARQKAMCRTMCWHSLTAVLIVLVLLTVDLALSSWFVYTYNWRIIHIPAALYTVLAVYNHLPLTLVRHSVVVGVMVSVAHLITSVLLFSPTAVIRLDHTSVDLKMLLADVVFYATANLIGVFTKCLNEVTLRRAFLDRRRCIETTIKLEYEKSQEEVLMLSILPKHIAAEVSKDIRAEIQTVIDRSKKAKHRTSPLSRKPFDKLYVEKHGEVTILFADIVNFTPLTATLPSGTLVSILNELFGKFDEAAKENNCLRIKILGDCYYCVSGIPDSTTGHARNCIEMGFRMIEIIRRVRRDHRVDVDMRIGVHSGSVISGLLGLRKWQYDIWSNDVTIANHMEQSGKAGMIHVSMKTKSLLGDAYDFQPGYGSMRDSYLAKMGIETFLLSPDYGNRDSGMGGYSPDVLDAAKKITFQLDDYSHNSDAGGLVRFSLPFSERSNDTQESSSNESLYERVPDNLEVSLYAKRNSDNVPSLYSTHAKSSRTASNADEQQEEIYSRLVKSNRKSSLAGGVGRVLVKRQSMTCENTIRRGAVLGDSSLISFRQMMDQADSKMESAVETMHFSKFPSKKRPGALQVNFFLGFSDFSWELPFLLRSDPLFKLYVIGAIPIVLGVGAIQLILYSGSLQWFWLTFAIAIALIVLFSIVFWSNALPKRVRLCSERLSSIVSRSNSSTGDSEMASILAGNSQTALRQSLLVRVAIFLLVTVAVGACGIVDLNVINDSSANNRTDPSAPNGCQSGEPSIYLWYFTYCCALTMTVTFGFYRIHFLLKLAVYVATIACYSFLVRFNEDSIDSTTCSFSPSMNQEVSHIVYVVCIMLTLHTADRQIEFIHRLDFVWQRKLVKEQEEANTTRMVNKLLLLNILPLHVAEVYLDTSRTGDELYHEDYKAVAVMFASIPHYMDQCFDGSSGGHDANSGLHALETLNQIISGFDALSFELPFLRIEKIKVVGSTYMAACGLSCNQKGSISSISEVMLLESEEVSMGSLVTMIRFANAMKDLLDKLNKRLSTSFQLRIGIDYGPVIAGVVGAQKPLYDIWGETVNMASRLEYSSQLGQIQVTEKTATLLIREGFSCVKRGETNLKGIGRKTTFFVQRDFSPIYETLPRTLSLNPSEALLPALIASAKLESERSSISYALPAVPEEDAAFGENFNKSMTAPAAFRKKFAKAATLNPARMRILVQDWSSPSTRKKTLALLPKPELASESETCDSDGMDEITIL